MRLSYPEIQDIRTAYNLIQNDRYALGPIEVELFDKVVVLPRRRVVISILFWGLLTSFGENITSEYLLPSEGAFTAKTLASVQNTLYRKLLAKGHDRDRLKYVMWEQLNEIYRFIRDELVDFQATIDLFTMAKFSNDPALQQIVDVDISTKMGVALAEKRIKQMDENIDKYLKDPKNKEVTGAMRYIKLSDCLSTSQLRQIVGVCGIRADVNESIIMHPIQSNLLNGLGSVEDYYTEAAAARKASFYTDVAVEKSQYLARKLHLMSMTLERRYEHDCGSRLTIPFHVPAAFHSNIQGAVILEGNAWKMIMPHETKNYVGKTVHMKGPLTCRHTDGYCDSCCGGLRDYIDPNFNTGMVSTVQTVDPMSQGLLSTKHNVLTSSIEYSLPFDTSIYFRIENGLVYFTPEFIATLSKEKDSYLGISEMYIRSIYDFSHISNTIDLRESFFSNVPEVLIKINKDVVAPITINLIDENGQSPKLTKKALLYIKEHINETILEDGIFWIPLKYVGGLRRSFEFMKTAIVNDSLLAFVAKFTRYISNELVVYKDLESALNESAIFIWRKLQNINILHIQTLLKAFMVTNKMNFMTPIVQDIRQVHFGTMDEIIGHRTISNQLGYQNFPKFIEKPETYIYPRINSPFDLFVGL